MKILKKKHDYFQANQKTMGRKLGIVLMMGLISMSSFAQNQKKGHKKSEMSPEQIAELQTKRMLLSLELTESQQKKIYSLNKDRAIDRRTKREEIAALREKGEKPLKKDAYERKNARLNKTLAHQNDIKGILNDGQYETWKKSRKHKAHKVKKMHKLKKRKQRAKGKKRKGRKGQK